MSRLSHAWLAALGAVVVLSCGTPSGSSGATKPASAGAAGSESGGSTVVAGSSSQATGGLGGSSGGAGAAAATTTGGQAKGAAGAATSSAGNGGGGNGGESAAGASSGSGGTASDTDRCDVARYVEASPPQLLELKGNLGTHDPMVLAAEGKFYLFSTGNNLGAKTSSDLTTWQAAPDVLSASTRPDWLAQQVPGVTNLWAPDASFFGGAYHLYYAASTFGSNRSCIGHLSRASLSAGSWVDQGAVFCSNISSTDDFNAIDPNVLIDTDGTPWLSFGSFWSGIKLIKLDMTGARDGTSLEALAARPSAGGALEAPFIVRRCGFYYLFTSWDKCCQGADSTYNIRVGRASTVHGPFVDHDGKALLQGGGTQVLKGGARYRGPGHNAVVFTNDKAYNVYHSYDADNNGASVLRVAELAWDADGWPISAGP